MQSVERREDDVFVLGHAEFTMRHPTIRDEKRSPGGRQEFGRRATGR